MPNRPATATRCTRSCSSHHRPERSLSKRSSHPPQARARSSRSPILDRLHPALERRNRDLSRSSYAHSTSVVAVAGTPGRRSLPYHLHHALRAPAPRPCPRTKRQRSAACSPYPLGTRSNSLRIGRSRLQRPLHFRLSRPPRFRPRCPRALRRPRTTPPHRSSKARIHLFGAPIQHRLSTPMRSPHRCMSNSV